MGTRNHIKRVLVVDDNKDAADLTADLLNLSGHSTRAVYGGESSLRVAMEFTPDVVLLDLGMPVMDGFAVASALRKMPAFNDVILIAYSAWSDAPTRERAMACGFDGHLQKPSTLEDILATVESFRGKEGSV